MQFQLVDQIIDLASPKSIRAAKNLSLGEEYLADHFPAFPVMPGVLMLEALVQSAAWLVRVADDFAHSMIVLRELKSVKYGSFVEPGKQLLLTVDLAEEYSRDAKTLMYKGVGEVEGVSAVTARFAVERYNLQDRDAALADVDIQLVNHYRGLYRTLRPHCQRT
jgi:3-hydroxyacyl-[acyl-carrier-protein] dehydratase